MDLRARLLWFDGSAGLVVGAAMVLLRGWLAELYGLPQDLLLFMGVVNLLYGLNSSSLAARSLRPQKLIVVLVVANLMWALVCLVLAVSYGADASVLGLLHLLVEGVFVGGLGCLEWRWRGLLATA